MTLGVGAVAYGADMLPHPAKEGLDVSDRRGMDELAVVELEADPEVVHENREECHDKYNANWTTKFITERNGSAFGQEADG